MLVAAFAAGQNKNLDEVKITPPQFTGISNVTALQSQHPNKVLQDYLQTNFIYPKEAIKCNRQGTEVVKFVVTPEGSVTDVNIINGVCPSIDEELVRVLKTTSGMWIPAHGDEQPVAMEKEVSMIVVLEDNINHRYSTPQELFTKKATDYFEKGVEKLFVDRNAKKALKLFDKGVNYLPYDKNLLLMRGLCRFETDDQEGARSDWDRMTSLGGIDMSEITAQAKDLKGYQELVDKGNK